MKLQNFNAIFFSFFSMNLIFSTLHFAFVVFQTTSLHLESENRCKDRILLWKIKYSGQKICKKSQFFLIFAYTYIYNKAQLRWLRRVDKQKTGSNSFTAQISRFTIYYTLKFLLLLFYSYICIREIVIIKWDCPSRFSGRSKLMISK